MNLLSNINEMLDNKNVSTIITLCLALYAGLAAPALPNEIILFFDTVLGRILLVFLIGFTASKNIEVALMVAVAFVVTLHVLNQRSIEQYQSFKYLENFKDHEGDMDMPDSDDNNDTVEDEAGDDMADDDMEDDSGDEMNDDADENKDMEQDVDPEEEEGNSSLNMEKLAERISKLENKESFIDLSEDTFTDDEDLVAENFRNYRNNYMPGSSNFNVKAANNLNGDPNKMYVPVNYN